MEQVEADGQRISFPCLCFSEKEGMDIECELNSRSAVIIFSDVGQIRAVKEQ